MTLAFGASGGFSGQSGTSMTLSVPAGVSNGDLLLMLVSVEGDETITTPTGWTQESTNTTGGTTSGDARVSVFSRTASSEPSSYSVTVSGSGLMGHGCIVSYTGNNVKIKTSNSRQNTTSSTIQTVTAISTTLATTATVAFIGCIAGSNDPTQTDLSSGGSGFSRAKGTFFKIGSQIADLPNATSNWTETTGVNAKSVGIAVLIWEASPTIAQVAPGSTSFTGLAPTIGTGVTVTQPSAATATCAGLAPSLPSNITVTQPSPATVSVATGANFIYELYFGVITADSPTNWWHLDDSSGTTMAAQTGSINGTYNADTLTLGATSFNENACVTLTSGRIDFGAHSFFCASPSAALSLEMWVKTSQSHRLLWGEGNTNSATTNFFFLALNASGFLTMEFDSSGSGETYTASTHAINDGGWHQIVLTRTTRVSSLQTWTGYVDGTQVFSGVTNFTVPSNSTAPSHVFGLTLNNAVSTAPGGAGSNITGSVDEISIWNKALSAGDVTTHYNFSNIVHPISVTPTAGTVSMAGQVPAVTTGKEVTITAPSAGISTYTGKTPNLSVNGGIAIGVDSAGAVTAEAAAPTITLTRSITVTTIEATVVTTPKNANVFVETQDFTFIPETDTSFTALDAEGLNSLDLGAMAHGQTKYLRFRLGNLAAVATNFGIQAVSANADIPNMVRFSLDNATYSSTLVIESVPANGVTDVIWVKFTVAAAAQIDNGSFLIQVVQTSAV